ncbi:MAG: [FeFe] hydrogenase H-cluster maturation GTPase HydF [Candidatus Muirbacterium halophilum]|nr:[FeFe] hydrogenase H-cluster maturation GTPase HydF [Candidatus Muirbacterium halophilum]MCK9476489.1 [FeFe] hydrogenase H-cluster maturation GTPase HydF [Candidatus Muirbacterium halophilum]
MSTKGNRMQLGIFGRRNAGKSSLINALTNQNIALVSDVAGTTTDPVYKAMEILPIGSVSLIDTAGIDDSGELGDMRVKKSRQVLNKCDFVLIVVSADLVLKNNLDFEKEFIADVRKRQIPVVLVINKIDLKNISNNQVDKLSASLSVPVSCVSAFKIQGIEELKQIIIKNNQRDWIAPTILGDLITPGDVIFLVCPIDSAAPKGRLILPQVQTIRDILDNNSISVVVKDTELAHAFKTLGNPKLVITDSQEFQKVGQLTPKEVSMTSFSILFARYKGDLEIFMRGINRIKNLKDGDKILMAEACTHHSQEDDIGKVKIPKWLRENTGKDLIFEHYAGSNFPEDMSKYSLAVHCGACMINRREMLYRLRYSEENSIPIVNYGMIIAYMHNILDRALKPFPDAMSIYKKTT